MGYRVHRVEVDMNGGEAIFERFLDGLTGEVTAIIPHHRRMSLTQIYGAGERIDFLWVVEKG